MLAIQSGKLRQMDMKRRSGSNGDELTPLTRRPHLPGATRADVTPFLEACASTPDVDAEQVKRARSLLENGGYPSDEVIQMIARQLARDWPANSSKPKRDS